MCQAAPATFSWARAGAASLVVCSALAAPAARADLHEWRWDPEPSADGLHLMGERRHWATTDPRGLQSPDSQVLGLFSGAVKQTVQVQGTVTLGALSAYGGGVHSFESVAGGNSAGALVLANDQFRAALLVGNGVYDSVIGHTEVSFDRLAMTSAGAALINHGSSLLLGQSQWGHDGDLVVGASPQGSGAQSLLVVQGSTLSGGIFGGLALTVGSASSGRLNALDGSTIGATLLTIGSSVAGGSASQVQIGLGSSLRVDQTMQLGRLAAGELVLGSLPTWSGTGTARLDAEKVTLGGQDGGAGNLRIDVGGEAVIHNLEVAAWAGSRGDIQVAAGGTLTVSGTLRLGGDGVGTAVIHGSLEASRLSVGGSPGGMTGGSGRLETFGSVVVGNPAQPLNLALTLSSHGHWLHAGTGHVHGSVEMGSYGSDDIELRVASGGVLQVHGTVGAGDYHLMQPAAAEVHIVVEDGALLGVDRLELYGNASLSGRGTVHGDVWLTGGTVAPGASPGWLTVDGNLRISSWAGGRLVIELGGTAAGTEYDVLEVLGTLDLGDQATIELVAVNGFQPDAGQSFSFLRATTVTGSFGELIDHTGAGFALDGLRWTGNGFVVSAPVAVPEPGTWALWLVGLAAVGRARRASGAGAIAIATLPR